MSQADSDGGEATPFISKNLMFNQWRVPLASGTVDFVVFVGYTAGSQIKRYSSLGTLLSTHTVAGTDPTFLRLTTVSPGDILISDSPQWAVFEETALDDETLLIGGLIGPAGSKGTKGLKGPEGAKGPKGFKNIQGPTGPEGAKGPTGPKGPIGPDGLPGPQGAAGPQGNKGINGDKGIKGLKGTAGPNNEDKGAKGEWNQGDKGIKGLKGPGGVGSKGIKGETSGPGDKGEKGIKGSKGIKGEKGEKGISGDKGLKGPAGPSDKRLKDNITGISDPLQKVLSLRGVEFIWREENLLGKPMADAGRKDIGFIAQEVKEVLPEVVLGDEETGYRLQYGQVISLLFEAVKEQEKMLDEREIEIEELEKKIL